MIKDIVNLSQEDKIVFTITSKDSKVQTKQIKECINGRNNTRTVLRKR